MFAYLSGKLSYISPTEVHLDCNGVGYLVNITLNTFAEIENKKEAKLFIHFHVREDAQILYGFSTQDEKQMFVQLISVSGVGPNTGRLILSSMTTNELSRAIINEEVSLIQTIKGIGPKSAKRLVLELKDKVKNMEHVEEVTTSGSNNAIIEEALSALTLLGFGKAQSEKVIKRVTQNNKVASVEELIKLSLKNL